MSGEAQKQLIVIGFSDIRKNVLENQLESLKTTLSEAKKFLLKLPVLPRPELKIRTAKKRLVSLGEGSLARLEYAFTRTLLKPEKPTIRSVAILSGDYKAAIGYLYFMSSLGIIEFSSQEVLPALSKAHLSLSQKRYERTVKRLLDAEFDLSAARLDELDKEELPCIYYEREILCKYIAKRAPKTQLKAYIRAINEAIA